MANRKDVNYIYTPIDKIFRLSFGEHGDFSGAKYDGDFSMTLEAAQQRKHDYIIRQLGIHEGSKVLDMGCGWGPFLTQVKRAGGKGIGLTLSDGQAASCRKNGLDVHVMDCRNVTPDKFGTFDALCSIGAFEHFASVEDYFQGKQDAVYAGFFEHAAGLIPKGGRFFLQTMVFGKNMLPYDQISLDAPKDSDSYILALMIKQFPGSWLPYGDEQILRNAQPHFKLVEQSSGRLDYIETIKHWRENFYAFNLEKYLIYLSLLPKYLTDSDMFYRAKALSVSPNKICFEREIMEHYRFVLERV
ncbi:MAG: class I SAM-dependent methyltransferase [Chitinophagales bacterium]